MGSPSGGTVASAMPAPAIEFDRATFAWRPADAPVLDELSVQIPEGEVVAVVGRSGAGKSTVLKLVNRMLLPTSGRVIVSGRDTREWDPIQLRRRVGYVIQDVGLFPHWTVAQNVATVPQLQAWPTAQIDARVRELLELVGLPSGQFASKWPDELSGGERQRVGVARAIAAEPPVLLMDEPFGALDPLTRAELHREFRRIRQHVRTTVLLVTHDMGEAFALADRIGVLESGHLVAYDESTRIADSSDPRVRRLLDALPSVPRPQP
ncbi:MAG TPA: ATP-binding cassette domain-containing protein [Rhodanobacteraceae bacterium]